MLTRILFVLAEKIGRARAHLLSQKGETSGRSSKAFFALIENSQRIVQGSVLCVEFEIIIANNFVITTRSEIRLRNFVLYLYNAIRFNDFRKNFSPNDKRNLKATAVVQKHIIKLIDRVTDLNR